MKNALRFFLINSYWWLFLFIGGEVFSQTSFPNSLQAAYTQELIILDGNLDEEIWQNAPRIGNFTQRELNFGEPSTEKTEVAIAFNEEFLYIAVWCFDSEPDKIIAKEYKRDFARNLDDNFIIIIDTYGDKRNGFMFVTNPIAARLDLMVFNNGAGSNTFWNGVWDVKTKITDKGWFAEFEIPFYTLKYRPDIESQSWGINFERNIRRKREQVLWQGWSRNNRIEQVTYAGTLTGLNKLRDKQFVEVKPYVIGGAERQGGKDNFLVNAGGDVNYLLSPTYRLNLTFNTDFAQVEADQQQINITRFPLFFPELREFFLEGDDFFDMGFGGNRIIPFYTRRIGLDQNVNPVPILAGGRLLGKEQNRTVGLMSIQTAATSEQQSTNYSAASWRQDIGDQSVVGVMTANKIEKGRWHSTTSVNGRFSTSKFLRNKNLDAGGAFIQTYNSDTGLINDAYAYRAFLSYPNDLIRIFASTQRSPANFEPEMGLMRRRDFREYFASIGFGPRPKNKFTWIRQFDFSPGVVTLAQYDDNLDLQSFEYSLRYFGFDTRSGERLTFDYQIIAEGLREDFNIRPDITIPADMYWWRQNVINFNTFRGRTFSINSRWMWGGFYDGSITQNISELFWRTGKYFNISLRYEKNIVAIPFGRFQSDLIGSRMEYAFSPNTFGSLLTQWNNIQNEVNINLRLRIIPIIGTDIFLIVNQLYDTSTQSFDAKRSTVLTKVIWRFAV